MRKPNVFGHTRALPRMSWSPHNLFNLYQRTVGSKAAEAQFSKTNLTLFQQRWISKRLLRAYHGDHVPETSFKKWYLPRTIPDVRPRKLPRVTSLGVSEVAGSSDPVTLGNYRGASRSVLLERKRRRENEEQGLAPVGSLMWSEIERRIDVLVFRACFAHSVYEARRMIVHGNVLLNGKKHSNANTRIAPGDMVSVDPKAIRFLQPKEGDVAPAAAQVQEEPTEAAETESKPDTELSVESSAPASSEPTSASSTSTTESPSSPPASTSPPTSSSTTPPYSTTLTPLNLPPYSHPFLFIPAYLEVSFSTCSFIYVRHPTARPNYSEIPTPYEADGEVMRLCWEWYVKRRPRMRGARGRGEGGPENRVEGMA